MSIIYEKRYIWLAIDCIKKQQHVYAVDAHLAEAMTKPPDYFARRLEQYNELGQVIEYLEGLLEHD